MSTPLLSELVRGSSLRGAAPSVLSAATCTRVGRALGTLLRQRLGAGARRVVVGRTHDGAQLGIRDGLVRGLVMSGHDVLDVGVCSSDVFAFALTHLRAEAGVLATTSEGAVHNLMFFAGGSALVGDGLAALCIIGDEGELSAGEGTLELVDVRPAHRAHAPEAA